MWIKYLAAKPVLLFYACAALSCSRDAAEGLKGDPGGNLTVQPSAKAGILFAGYWTVESEGRVTIHLENHGKSAIFVNKTEPFLAVIYASAEKSGFSGGGFVPRGLSVEFPARVETRRRQWQNYLLMLPVSQGIRELSEADFSLEIENLGSMPFSELGDIKLEVRAISLSGADRESHQLQDLETSFSITVSKRKQ